MAKGENAPNQHFLLFPQCSTLPKANFSFRVTLILSSANAFNFDKSKILLFAKELKAFAHDKINMTEKLKFHLEWVELNIVGKGENAGYQQFLLSPQCFQKDSYTELLKVEIVWERVKRTKNFKT